MHPERKTTWRDWLARLGLAGASRHRSPRRPALTLCHLSGQPLEQRRLLALEAQLLADIEKTPLWRSIDALTVVDSAIYYVERDINETRQLVRLDTRENSTNVLAIFDKGWPQYLTNVSGTLFFVAEDSTHGYELWKSDGTESGTHLVYDITPGKGNSSPRDLTAIGDTLYFSAADATHGRELWKSNGTSTGTQLVSDIQSGSGSSVPGYFTNVDGTIFFRAGNTATGSELWKTDGTSSGTQLVRDILPGSPSSSVANLSRVGRTLFFTANDATHGRELWKSDGTRDGTVLVRDISPGVGSSSPRYLTNVGGTLFFRANNGVSGEELWKSDGTVEGTQLTLDIYPGPFGSNPSALTVVNETLFFTADDSVIGRQLWRSDGTSCGTRLVREIGTGVSDIHHFGPRWLANLGGTLYFQANDVTHGYELWKSDGTSFGTQLVCDIAPGNDDSGGEQLTSVGGSLYFLAFESPDIGGLWRSDGTSSGTTVIRAAWTRTEGSYPSAALEVNGILYFTLQDLTRSRHSDELWRSDGTSSGTFLVSDISPEIYGAAIYHLTNADGLLYFVAVDYFNDDVEELWRSDGTSSGTFMIHAVQNTIGFSQNPPIASIGGTLFFMAEGESYSTQIWTTDGTQSGTTLLYEGAPGFYRLHDALMNVNGVLYFAARDPTHGIELWKSDGTSGGTQLVRDIAPGSSGANPGYLINFSGTLFFRTRQEGGSFELWRSDGTSAGTSVVSSIFSTRAPNYLRIIESANEMLYLVSDAKDLWRSDGTSSGTWLLREFESFERSNEVNFSDAFFFFANDGSHGSELWQSDGTCAGTVLVRDITPGDSSYYHGPIVNVGSTLYFRVYDKANGPNLWRSDGTSLGTEFVFDVDPFNAFPVLPTPTRLNDTLVFGANDGIHGRELWILRHVPPHALAGPSSGYTVAEGDTLTLDASASFSTGPGAAITTYAWDLNGDGLFTDATGANPTIAWSQLVAFGLSDGPATYPIRVRVTDNEGDTADSEPVSLVVGPAPPTSLITGAGTGRVGDTVYFFVWANDPSPADQAGPIAYRLDWDGDGIADQTVTASAAPTLVSHRYAAPGTYTIGVRARDRDAAYGPATAWTVTITGTAIADIDLRGGVVSIPAGDTSPTVSDGTDFGYATLLDDSSYVTRTFTIANTGGATLNLSSVTLTGAVGDYTLTQPPGTTSIAPGRSTTLGVRFSPQATGLRAATVVVASNDLDETPYRFALWGRGLFPSNLSLGTQADTGIGVAEVALSASALAKPVPHDDERAAAFDAVLRNELSWLALRAADELWPPRDKRR